MSGRALLRAAVFALAVAASVPSAGAATPGAIAARYEVRMNGLEVARLEESYTRENDAYRLTSESTPRGLFALVPALALRFVSTGSVTPRGLRPQRFEGWRGKNEQPEVAAEFDWKARELQLLHEGRNDTKPLAPGTQDRLSVMYDFMFAVPRASGTVDVAVTNGRGISLYTYTVTRDVEIDTPLGRLATVHLVKGREAGGSQNEIWLSTAHAHVPVRMIIVERDGTRYEQIATELTIQP